MNFNSKKPKVSSDITKEIELKKTTNFKFSFTDFELGSIEKGIVKDFSNYYLDQNHFLKVNESLFSSMKILSNENYKSAIINHSIERTMHFKILNRPESIERVENILKGYGKSNSAIEQWKDSQYVEFGVQEERFIGIIIDYNTISILYADPNHLTFPDDRFDNNTKLSFTVPSFYTKDSTSTFINKYSNYDKDKDFDKLEFCKIAFLQNQCGEMSDVELDKYLKEYYGGKNE